MYSGGHRRIWEKKSSGGLPSLSRAQEWLWRCSGRHPWAEELLILVGSCGSCFSILLIGRTRSSSGLNAVTSSVYYWTKLCLKPGGCLWAALLLESRASWGPQRVLQLQAKCVLEDKAVVCITRRSYSTNHLQADFQGAIAGTKVRGLDFSAYWARLRVESPAQIGASSRVHAADEIGKVVRGVIGL